MNNSINIKSRNCEYTSFLDLGVLANSEIKEDYVNLRKSVPIRMNGAINGLKINLQDEEIKKKLSESKALVLGVTEACNLRCRYCTFSGSYFSRRKHSKKKMSLTTAKKAVDFFLRDIVANNPRNKREKTLYIGFYGGEPFLEFNLIKDIVKYSNTSIEKRGLDQIFDFQYQITTNGVLLGDKKIQDFIVKNNIRLDLSLDGPQKEHDKFRVFKDGKGSWNKVLQNINSIKRRYPDYLKECIKVLVTMHPHHDGEAIDRFFEENSDLFDQRKVTVNLFNISFLKPGELRKIDFQKGKKSEFYFDNLWKELEDNITFEDIARRLNFTGNCFPGSVKMFISPDGNIMPCERCSVDLPELGNVTNGFNYSNIRGIQKAFNKEIEKRKCWTCPIATICTVCMANVLYENHEFTFNCKDRIEAIKDRLTLYIEKKEKVEDEESKNSHPYADFYSFMDSL